MVAVAGVVRAGCFPAGMVVRAGVLRQTQTQRWLMVALRRRLSLTTVNRAVTRVEARLGLTTAVAVAGRAWLVKVGDWFPQVVPIGPAMVGTARRLQLGQPQHPQVIQDFTLAVARAEPETNLIRHQEGKVAGAMAGPTQVRLPPLRVRTEPAEGAAEPLILTGRRETAATESSL